MDERTYLSIVSWTTADARSASIAECQRRAGTDAGARTVMEALRRMRRLFTSFQVLLNLEQLML